jgi:hypothetical protein
MLSANDRTRATQILSRELNAAAEAAAAAVDLLRDPEVELVLDLEHSHTPALALAALVYRARLRANDGTSPRGELPEVTAVRRMPLPDLHHDDVRPLRIFRASTGEGGQDEQD